MKEEKRERKRERERERPFACNIEKYVLLALFEQRYDSDLAVWRCFYPCCLCDLRYIPDGESVQHSECDSHHVSVERYRTVLRRPRPNSSSVELYEQE